MDLRLRYSTVPCTEAVKTAAEPAAFIPPDGHNRPKKRNRGGTERKTKNKKQKSPKRWKKSGPLVGNSLAQADELKA